jgi:hypothetical protein
LYWESVLGETMLSRKYYQMLAKLLRKHDLVRKDPEFVDDLMQKLREDNFRFDPRIFKKAAMKEMT